MKPCPQSLENARPEGRKAIAELAAHLDAATARLLDLIREFDAYRQRRAKDVPAGTRGFDTPVGGADVPAGTSVVDGSPEAPTPEAPTMEQLGAQAHP